MPNLIEQLGSDYVDQFYRGAIFMLDDKIVMYGRHAEDGTIACKAFPKDSQNPTFRAYSVSPQRIDSMDVFGWPKLGYREFTTDKGCKHVYFVTLTRSAMRGMRDDLLSFNPVPVARLLPAVRDIRGWVSSALYAQAIFCPKFSDFDEGIKKLREGAWSSFALSEDIAVCISTSKGNKQTIDVLFKEHIIGQVLPDGTVAIPHKIAKRASSMALFKGKVVF